MDNDKKGKLMPTPGNIRPKRPTWSATSFASASLDDALRTVLSRVDARKATVDQVRDHLAAAGILAPREWVRGWLREVNERACR
jgi:hypothetical protein